MTYEEYRKTLDIIMYHGLKALAEHKEDAGITARHIYLEFARSYPDYLEKFDGR